MPNQSKFKQHIREQTRKSNKCLANLIPGFTCGRCFSKESIEKVKDILLDHDVIGPTSAYSHVQLLELARLLLCKQSHRENCDGLLVKIWTSEFSILVPLTLSTGASSSLDSDRENPPAPNPSSSGRHGEPTLEIFDERSHGSLLEQRAAEGKGRLSNVQGIAVPSSSPLSSVGSKATLTTPARNHNRGEGYVEEIDTPNTQYSDIWTPDHASGNRAITSNTPDTPQDTQDLSEDLYHSPGSPTPGPYRQRTQLDRMIPSRNEAALTTAIPVTRRLFEQPSTAHTVRTTSDVPESRERSAASVQPDNTIAHNLRSRRTTAPKSAPDRFSFRDYRSPTSLKDFLIRNLTKDNTAGYVYVYTLPNAPGHVKIGFTRERPAKRLKQIKSACKYKDEPVQCEDPFQRVVSNVRRLEELVHGEFASHRKYQELCGCPVKHAEWFEIEPEQAVAVVEKWRKWIEMEPYGEDKKLKSNWKQQVDLLFAGQKTVDQDCPRWGTFLEGKLECSGDKAQEVSQPARGSLRTDAPLAATPCQTRETLQATTPVLTVELLWEAMRVLQASLASLEAVQSRTTAPALG